MVTLRQPTWYESSVTLVVQTSAGANDTETLVRTMIALVDSEVVGAALSEQVDSALGAEEIAANLAVDRPPGSSVLTVYYYDTDRARSVETAQAIIPVFQEQVADLEAGQAGQLAPNYAIQPWGGGAAVTVEIPASILRNAAIAALLGAALGGVGAVLHRQRNPLVRTARDAEEATRLPVLATPRPLDGGRGRARWHPADSVEAVLGGLPAALGRETLPRRILVVGTDTGRPRAVFVTHLARALQQQGTHPTLVDADLDAGRLTRHLELSDRPGLADALRSDGSPAEAVLQPEAGLAAGLPVLPAGRELPLRSASAAVAITRLDDERSALVVDAPAMSADQSLGPLLRTADAVLLLVDADRATITQTTTLAGLVRSLGRAPAVTVLFTDRPGPAAEPAPERPRPAEVAAQPA
ncbi:hypothetical protein [Geodermatophilus ruber]|uniref:Capsular polysaccharide biosynthesis protein n=1 Tax=Geodermatophilus ruber TaxID=504800 RepID=A0A1I4DG72_9ACTN|nr:hypothetical protein [Geodermatophilus ruber]SFK92205.1 Capsular polysaccharide biosynthesis protein [Geodermatophilus ruber]